MLLTDPQPPPFHRGNRLEDYIYIYIQMCVSVLYNMDCKALTKSGPHIKYQVYPHQPHDTSVRWIMVPKVNSLSAAMRPNNPTAEKMCSRNPTMPGRPFLNRPWHQRGHCLCFLGGQVAELGRKVLNWGRTILIKGTHHHVGDNPPTNQVWESGVDIATQHQLNLESSPGLCSQRTKSSPAHRTLEVHLVRRVMLHNMHPAQEKK